MAADPLVHAITKSTRHGGIFRTDPLWQCAVRLDATLAAPGSDYYRHLGTRKSRSDDPLSTSTAVQRMVPPIDSLYCPHLFDFHQNVSIRASSCPVRMNFSTIEFSSARHARITYYAGFWHFPSIFLRFVNLATALGNKGA